MRRPPPPDKLRAMDREHRIEPREVVSLPIELGNGQTGTTRDISASGVFFETDTDQAPGSEVDFSIDFDTPGGPMRLKCRGTIVRTERHGGRQGAAVKIVESRFEARA